MNKTDLTTRIERYINKESSQKKVPEESDILSDQEFDEALEIIRQNGVRLYSIKNVRRLNGFLTDDGRKVKDDLLIRSGNLSHLTSEEASFLKEQYNLSLVIDLRTPAETQKAPDIDIPGVKHRSIPLAMELDTIRMDHLSELYFQSKNKSDKARIVAEYARIDEVARMYRNISVNERSLQAIREIFRLLIKLMAQFFFTAPAARIEPALSLP